MHSKSDSKVGKYIISSFIAFALIISSSLNAQAAAVLDFDGDGKTDYVVARPFSGVLIWYLQRSRDGFQGTQWGVYPSTANADRVVPADYDGDGKCDIAVWRAGAQAAFYILRSQTNTLQAISWGTTGDNPNMTQDFDGDGKADPTVVRNVNGSLAWYIRQSTNNALRAAYFGVSGLDAPVRGNYDGDTKADLAVYRGGSPTPASTFYVLRSSNNTLTGQQFGNASEDIVTPGDYDGDGKTDYAVYRTDTGSWYWLQSSNGQVRGVQFGAATIDSASQGDYDGDGKTDVAVRRFGGPVAARGDFYVLRSRDGFTALHWGNENDIGVAAVFQNTFNPF